MAEEENGDNGYTQDGTVDLKGNPILRSKRGGWKACSFVIVYEVFERMAYYGISSNLILYLTRRLHQGTVTAANNVTNWVGTVWMTPILGAYFADALLGRYWTFIIASTIYLSGMSVLTLAVSVPGLKPPTCDDPTGIDCKKASTLQLAVFYGALYTLAIGTGGTKPNISTIGADQFDEFEPKEKAHKLSFFNWWMFGIFSGTLFANTVLVYIQDNVGWTLGYGLPTAGLAISIVIFLVGTPFYRHKKPTGSPFTKMAMVIVAAMRKSNVVLPRDPKELHELDSEVYAKKGMYRIDSTPSLREMHRLRVAKNNGVVENGKQVPLSIFILLPQFILMGTADAFLEVAKIEFFYDQAPENMKSLGTSYSMTSLGVGNFISSFLLSTVSKITKEHGHKGWILNNLNDSHLDYYYAFFAVLNFLNFIFFMFVTRLYVYKAEVSDSMDVLREEIRGSKELQSYIQ
ncbi:hypothetical protein Leryth_021806 [Lithospermum erythrorhizon]|nr:hypothetical protein Leryth_021806 [Lithospermum erythrorhizon]